MLRSRACLALPPGLLAFDQKDFGAFLLRLFEQSASLPGRRSYRRRGFARGFLFGAAVQPFVGASIRNRAVGGLSRIPASQ